MVVQERELADITPQPTADAIHASLRRGGASPRQVMAILFVGTITSAFFASRDLSSWAERLGTGSVVEQTQNIATRWDQVMAKLGLAQPHDTLRFAVRSILDYQWGGGSPAGSAN
jgi:hypothetical protein